MIAKAVKGKGFRGALEYDLGKGAILDTNMAGHTARELAKEFGEVRQLRPTLGKAVLHVSLALPPGEHLDDDQWRDVAGAYLEGMGLTDNQFVVTRHSDTQHEHIHILTNRITHTGQVVSDSQDYRRQEDIMRKIEQTHGLQQVASSTQSERRAPSKGEIEQGLRTGQPSARQQLQQLCDAAAQDCTTFTQYQERLEAAGVDLIPTLQQGGTKLSGIQYQLDGVTMKGSDLGKGYAAAGLQKRGISYDQDRDAAAISRCSERAAHQQPAPADRSLARGETGEHRDPGFPPRTPGPGPGEPHRRHAGDPGRDQAEPGNASGLGPDLGQGSPGGGPGQPDQQRAADQGPAGGRPGLGADLDQGSPGPAGGRPGDQTGRPGPGPGAGLVPAPGSGAGGADWSGPADRIAALGAAAATDRPGRPGGGRPAQARPDRTAAAVQAQVQALGCKAFEIGIRDQASGRMMNRTMTQDELNQNLSWLKRMNAKGADIYIRPAGDDHGLVLVDDLKSQALAQMKADGHTPAAVTQTSPGNFQAWVKLSDQPVPPDVRREAARHLAEQYQGDLNSADSRHYGRLAGFTNRKPQHEHQGLQPFVRLIETAKHVAEMGRMLIEACGLAIQRRADRTEQQRRLELVQQVTPGLPPQSDPAAEYRRLAQPIVARYGQAGQTLDHSRMDWMIAKAMAGSGRYSQEAIVQGITQASPNIEARKRGHLKDYATRTVAKAWEETTGPRQTAVMTARHREAQELAAARAVQVRQQVKRRQQAKEQPAPAPEQGQDRSRGR